MSTASHAVADASGAVPKRPVAAAYHAQAVGSWVPRLTRAACEKRGFATASLLTDWPQIAGRDFAAWARPVKLQWPRPTEGADAASRGGATLVLLCDAARALEVQYAIAQLIERINAYFGYRAIMSVRVTQGVLEADPQKAPPSRQMSPPEIGCEPRQLNTVSHPELRASLSRLYANIAGRPARERLAPS